MSGTSETTIARTLAQIEAAAAKGERCPTNDLFPNSAAIGVLCRRGNIRVEVSMHNFRQVTILTGPHAGKSTQAPPYLNGHPPQPYLVMDTSGTKRNKRYRAEGRPQPSKPREIF